jgi:iron complex outermembrane receptor protein
MAGGGYRYSWDSIPDSPTVRFLPPQKAIGLVNGYLQDEIRLAETVSVSLGARLEHSRFSGQSVQPAAQFLWAPGERHSVWASVSRALRTPSRGEQGFSMLFGAIPAGQAGNPLPALVTLLGQNDMHSEKLLSYEAGYRHQISARLGVDLAGYYYDYSQLRAVAPAGVPTVVLSPVPHINMDSRITNGGTASNWGGEITANLKLTGRWRVFATYSHLEQRLTPAPGMWSGALAKLPHHLATVRSRMDLSRRLAFDTDVYSSGRQFEGLPSGSGGPLAAVTPAAVTPGSYVRWDARLTWKVSPAWEVMAGGENLLDRVHKELEPEALMVGGRVRRSFFARLTWRR